MNNKPSLGAGVALLSVLAISGFSTQSRAAGFALIENSASGQGNAYAGAAAAAQDASTVWFNPAGMMRLSQDQMTVAGHLIVPDAQFSNGNSTGAAALGSPPLGVPGEGDDGGTTALVANFYYVTAIDENLKFGLGVTTPFGLTTEYDENWIGRYHAVESDLKTININPSIAFNVNEDFSIGVGLNFMFADVTLTSAVDIGSVCAAVPVCAGMTPLNANGVSDGFADLTADNFDSVGLGINFGFMYDFSESARLGVAYRSEVDLDVEGDADFTVPAGAAGLQTIAGLFIDTSLRATVTLPKSLSVSFAQDMDRLSLLADVTWTGWSDFKELRIDYENPAQPDSVTTEEWGNTLRYSIGADYRQSDDLTLRAGIAFDETPVPSAERRTPRIPGNDRTWLSFGFTYMMAKTMSFDVGYSHLFVDDTDINNTFESGVPTITHTLNGTYEASVDILSAQLNWLY